MGGWVDQGFGEGGAEVAKKAGANEHPGTELDQALNPTQKFGICSARDPFLPTRDLRRGEKQTAELIPPSPPLHDVPNPDDAVPGHVARATHGSPTRQGSVSVPSRSTGQGAHLLCPAIAWSASPGKPVLPAFPIRPPPPPTEPSNGTPPSHALLRISGPGTALGVSTSASHGHFRTLRAAGALPRPIPRVSRRRSDLC